MTDNIFNTPDQGTQETPVVSTTPITPVVPPELAEYVGVGKKYASVDEVYKAFPNAQKHINTLESELAQAREELTKRRTAEELLNDIQAGIASKSVETTTAPITNTQDISQLVRQEIERKTGEDKALANQTTVVNEFKKVYGDKAKDIFDQLAIDLGVPLSSLNQLASTSPNAIFKLAGIPQIQNTQSGHLQSDINIIVKTQDKTVPSARVSMNGSSKDDAEAIRIAREYVLNQYK